MTYLWLIFWILNVCLTRYTDIAMANSKEVRDTSLSSRIKISFFSASPTPKSGEKCLFLEISHKCLREIDSYSTAHPDSTFVDILNANLNVIQLQQSVRIEKRIRVTISKVNSKFKRLTGVKKQAYVKQSYKLGLLENEVVNARQMSETVVEPAETPPQTPLSQSRQFDEMSKRQAYRTLNNVQASTLKALDVVRTLGLTPTSLKLKSSKGEKITINYDQEESVDGERENLSQILFVLDKFGVSDSTYHEIAQINKDLPRVGAVAEYRAKLSREFKIHRVPGNVPGAVMSFKKELESRVGEYLESRPNVEKVRIKFGGDGTRVSSLSNFVVFSFNIIDDAIKQSSVNQFTLAIISCKENYSNLKMALVPLFEEVNSIVKDKFIQIGDRCVEVDIFFGSDMKMIQLVLGLGGSTGNYACPLCKVHKDDRHNMTHDWMYFSTDPMCRTIDEIRSHSDKLQFGVQHTPLFEIAIDNFVLDELHLLMRITDVLERLIIQDGVARDKELAKLRQGKPKYLDGIVESIRSCGVSFYVWEDRDSKGLQWTSLSGDNKKKVLNQLPDKLHGRLTPDTETDLINVWTGFRDIFKFVVGGESSDARQLHDMAREWILLLLRVGEKRRGILKKNITPYMHCLVYHVPVFMSRHGNIGKFSGQALEKINDDIKRIHQQKTQKWDGPIETMTVRKRVESQSHLARTKRPYTKRKLEYWESELQEARSAKRANIQNDISSVAPSTQSHLDDMCVADLRDKLVSLGVHTKVSSREKLIDLIHSAMHI